MKQYDISWVSFTAIYLATILRKFSPAAALTGSLSFSITRTLNPLVFRDYCHDSSSS